MLGTLPPGAVFSHVIMSKKAIATERAPAAIGPYSQAILATGASGNGFLYTSGQIPLDPTTGLVVEGGIVEQTERTLENLEAVLAAGGCGWGDIVQCQIFVTSLQHFATVNEIYGRRFTAGPPPARITVEVPALPRGVLIEIAAVAVVPSAA